MTAETAQLLETTQASREARRVETVIKVAIVGTISLFVAAGGLAWLTYGRDVAFEMMMGAIWTCF